MAGTDMTVLAREWVHSHEEDQGYGSDALVFRPSSFPFPLSRSRWRLDLRSDHTMSETTPGPVDRPVTRSRSWAVNAGNQLVLGSEPPGTSPAVMDILEASPEKLVVRRPAVGPGESAGAQTLT